MKKLFTLENTIALIAMLALFVTLNFASTAFAEDKLVDIKITQSVTVKKDKNGNAYARTFIKEKRSLNGIEYDADTPLMFFGSTVEAAKKLRIGSTAKLIVSVKDYKGTPSYNVVAVLK